MPMTAMHDHPWKVFSTPKRKLTSHMHDPQPSPEAFAPVNTSFIQPRTGGLPIRVDAIQELRPKLSTNSNWVDFIKCHSPLLNAA